jgi:hypothetical protein
MWPPLLAGLAAAIGNSRRIRLKGGWSEPAVLWAAVVGESGTLKSPAADGPLHSIQERQEQALERHRQSMAEYALALVAHKVEVAEWSKKGRRDGSKPPVEPQRPVCPRFWVSDSTVEALAARLGETPRGLLLYRDELGGWLRSFNEYKAGKGGDVAHWLTIHGARSLLVDRKTGDKTTIHVPKAFVSVTGGIQPAILQRALTPEYWESGLAARLLLTMPPIRPKRWTEAEVDEELEQELADLFGLLYELDMPLDPATERPQPVLVPLTAEAKHDVWIPFYNVHAAELANLSGDLAAAWSKLEGYAARLALIIHCCKTVMGEADPVAVDPDSMAAGITLTQWFGQETHRVYQVLGESEEARDEREMTELMTRKGGSITVREATRSSRKYRDKPALAEEVLNRLVKAKKAFTSHYPPEPKRGQPTTIWHLAR